MSTASAIGGITGSSPSSESDASDMDQASVGDTFVRGLGAKPVPVMRWGLKYSGDNSALSLDLFSGRALTWFWADRKQSLEIQSDLGLSKQEKSKKKH